MPKISALPVTTSITGPELVPVVQGGITKYTEAKNVVPVFADYANLRTYTGSHTSVEISNAGKAGVFLRDTTDTTSADNAGTIIVSSDGTRWKRVYDGTVNVKHFGALGDGGSALLSSRYATLAAAQVDYPLATALTQSIDYCAFKAAHDCVRTTLERGDLFIPTGDYWLSETWHVTNALNIRGAGAGEFFDKAATRLRFATDVDGIRVHSVLAETPDPGKSATKTLIADILVYCPTKGTLGNGINATATVYLERVDVYNFAENGIRIFGSSAGGTGSCNLWSIRDSRSRANGGHGLFVSGPDTNAGVAINLDCSSNTGWGFLDSSLLGNTYIACHCNGNGIGSYKTTGTVADNVFIGCYREAFGHFGTEFVQPTHVYGGVLTGEDNLPFISITGDGTGATGKAIVNGSGVITGVHLLTRGTGYTTATATITDHGSGSGAVLGAVTITGTKVTSIAITSGGTGYVGNKKFTYFKSNGAVGGCTTNTIDFKKEGTSVRGGSLRTVSGADVFATLLSDGEIKYELLWNETQGTYELQFGAAKRVLVFGGNLSTQTGGRSAAITDGTYIGFPGGYWNGSTSNARFRDVGLSAPASGEWARGDTRDAMSPAAAGTPGWVCTTGGTAGSTAVFKTRAVIAA